MSINSERFEKTFTSNELDREYLVVSVIVPTYERAQIIKPTLKSILNQNYPNVELIVIDDGSTDNTQEIINDIATEYSRVINYYKKENGGCASARNLGMEIATGDYIVFLDSDDCLVQNALVSLVDTLEKNDADFVYSPAIEVYKDGVEIINLPVAAGRPENFSHDHFLNTNVRTGSWLFKREILKTVDKQDVDLRYNEDSDFLQRVAIKRIAAYLDFPTVKIFHHDDNKSNNRVEIYKALLKSTNKIISAFPEFADSLGTNVDARIEQIKIDLIKALVFSGCFIEANDIANSGNFMLSLGIRTSLLLHSKTPLFLENIGSTKLLPKINKFYKKFIS
jgi:glycosyltransferase involved in cell wall biosynthesis